MARNSLAGKRTGKSKTAKFYAANPKARAKKKNTIQNIIVPLIENGTAHRSISGIKIILKVKRGMARTHLMAKMVL